MTTEQRKVLTERLAAVEKKERRLYQDFNEQKTKSSAAASEWVLVSDELDFLKKLAAIPEEPAKAT